MPEYNTSGWATKANKRKAVRDTERDRFIAEAGATPVRAMDEIACAPNDQRMKMIKLLKITNKGDLDGDHKAALVAMARALASVGLGKGVMGDVSKPIVSPHDAHSKMLLDFFLLDYSQRERQ